jgi:hypothetical protein
MRAVTIATSSSVRPGGGDRVHLGDIVGEQIAAEVDLVHCAVEDPAPAQRARAAPARRVVEGYVVRERAADARHLSQLAGDHRSGSLHESVATEVEPDDDLAG